MRTLHESMTTAFSSALSLIGPGGLAIIGATLTTLLAAIAANLFLRAGYRNMERELQRNPDGDRIFEYTVLNRAVREARDRSGRSGDINVQAIVEDAFRSELRFPLLAERFVRSATGLVIILGLLGTFYGLTLSIGKLVGLVAGDAGPAADVAQVVTGGLTESLSGMSIAFSNSLFGIGSAVILTILGVLSNVTDRRMALMVQLETYIDRLLGGAPGHRATNHPTELAGVVGQFEQSVAKLEAVVTRFDAALQTFAVTTRDFREFNLHLKDNVQRMSLSFGDFSETLKSQIGAMKSRDQKS